MQKSPFGEFDPEELRPGMRSVAAVHGSTQLPVRIHFPPLSRQELLDCALTRLRIEHPGLPRILAYDTTSHALSEHLGAQRPYLVTEALEPVVQDDLPKRWSALRDRLVQLLECMGEAHAHNAFHGTLGYPWLFKVPGTEPLQLCVEGWFLNGTAKIPTAMERLMLAPECAANQTLHPNLLTRHIIRIKIEQTAVQSSPAVIFNLPYLLGANGPKTSQIMGELCTEAGLPQIPLESLLLDVRFEKMKAGWMAVHFMAKISLV